MHNRILIGKPYVETDESSAYLKADILFPDGGQKHSAFTENKTDPGNDEP